MDKYGRIRKGCYISPPGRIMEGSTKDKNKRGRFRGAFLFLIPVRMFFFSFIQTVTEW